MPEPLDDTGLEQLMSETRELIGSLRAGKAPVGDIPPEGRGADADERIRVIARTGRIESIRLDPGLSRLSPEEFGGLVRDAVNAAIGDLPGNAAGAVPDLAALSETLREVRDQGLRRMAIVTQGIEGAMARIRRRTSIDGDPAPRGLDELLGMARRNLDEVRLAAGGAEDMRGEGSAARGRMRVVASAGRVESVTVEPAAMRMASKDLAGQLTAAVNAAFGDLRARPGTVRVNAGDLAQRMREAQDRSIQQLHAYTRALREIMASIGDPEQEQAMDEVHPDRMRDAGAGVAPATAEDVDAAAAEKVDATIDALRARFDAHERNMADMAEICGDDDLGSLIYACYRAIHEAAFDFYHDDNDMMREHPRTVRAMADDTDGPERPSGAGRGMRPPGGLVTLLQDLGYDWPEPDEEELFRKGDDWLSFADQIIRSVGAANVHAIRVFTENGSADAEAFQAAWDGTDSPYANLLDGATGGHIIGVGLMICSGIVLALKINMIVQLVQSAVEIHQAIAAAPETFGASLAYIPVIKEITGRLVNLCIGIAMNAVLG